jgi:tetratricopeptide (TPR) repeat protein
MERVDKTVFLSYRRTNVPWALAIFQNLRNNGYDVFFDFDGIASGDFESVILGNITSRAHFIVLLTPSALERCSDPGDWLRREIETALESKRNIIPLMLEGFSFGTPAIASQLTGTLEPLKKYNALDIPPSYFLEAMGRLRDRYLDVPLKAVIHPMSASGRQAATEQKAAADAAPVVQEEELTAQQYFERAFAATDLDEQLRFYGEATRLQPDFASAFYNRSLVRYAKGDFDGAIADSNEALRLRPDNADAYISRGNARQNKGDINGAITDFTEAIRLKLDDAIAFNNRGAVRQIKGDFDDAIADFTEAIRLKPDYAAAFYNRGVTLKDKSDLAGAITDYTEAIRLMPEHANAFYNRASIFQEQGQPAAAIADFQEYLKLGGGDRDGDTAKVKQRIADLTKKL